MGYNIPSDHHDSGPSYWDGGMFPSPPLPDDVTYGPAFPPISAKDVTTGTITADKPDTGLRFNQGKTRFDLLPHDAIEALAQHYTIGAQKYADRNWEKGFEWLSCAASLMRHLFLWMAGEDYDVGPNGEWGPYPDQPEIDMKWTGSLHMTCVMWNAAALTTFALRRTGTDNRVKTMKSPTPIKRD